MNSNSSSNNNSNSSSRNSGEAMLIRVGEPADAATVAALHVASWRGAYRGILLDSYLDADIEPDRHAFWSAAIGAGIPPDVALFLAVRRGRAEGFVCVSLNPEPRHARGPVQGWGPRVENLHCRPESRGQGIGGTLLRRAAAWVEEQLPGSGLHLYVYTANEPARAFYRRMGGAEVADILVNSPDGQLLPEKICFWPSAARLSG